MDYGTLIADFKGQLHDVSKNAFDSFAKKNAHALTAGNKVLTESFQTTYNAFKNTVVSKLGISTDTPLTIENLGEKLKTTARDTALQLGVDAAVAMAGKYALEIEGPLGILISEAASLAIGAFESQVLGKTKYQPGQWIFLDVGSTTHHINEKPKVIQLATQAVGSIFGLGDTDEFAIVPEELDLTATPSEHAIGFYMAPNKESPYLHDVFSYKVGGIQQFHEDKIRPVSGDLAQKLDDSEFSLVREVLFLKEHDPTLKSYLPTNPGDTVRMKGQNYTLLRQAGDEFVLEDSHGREILVHSSEITGGKVDNNTSWDHARLHIGTFQQRAIDMLHRGEWVWIPQEHLLTDIADKFRRRLKGIPDELSRMGPNDKVLGLVSSIEDDKVNVVRAYDGQAFSFKQEQVYGTSSGLDSTLCKQNSTKKWRSDFLKGFNPTLHPLSETHPYLALGIGEQLDELPREATMYPSARAPDTGQDLSWDDTLKATVGNTNVNGQKVDMQDYLDDEANFYRESAQYSVESAHGLKGSEDSGGGGNGASFLIILAGAAIIFSLAG